MVGLNAQEEQLVAPLAGPVDAQEPWVVVRAPAEAEAVLDLLRGVVALVAEASDSSSALATAVEPRAA